MKTYYLKTPTAAISPVGGFKNQPQKTKNYLLNECIYICGIRTQKTPINTGLNGITY
jgi:hypothetical protein